MDANSRQIATVKVLFRELLVNWPLRKKIGPSLSEPLYVCLYVLYVWYVRRNIRVY